MAHSLDEFRAAAASLPPSHVPTPAEAAGLLGALFAFEQFGDDFFAAAEADAEAIRVASGGGQAFTNADSKVLALYAGAQDQSLEEATAGTAPVGSGAPSVSVADQSVAPVTQAPQGPEAAAPAATAPDDRDAQIASLKQQVQNLTAARDRTRADVERDTSGDDVAQGTQEAAPDLTPAPPSTSADAGVGGPSAAQTEASS